MTVAEQAPAAGMNRSVPAPQRSASHGPATLVARQNAPTQDANFGTRPTVSLIVPVYNGGEKFRKCLASIAALSPAPLEVIVVSDGDTDGSSQHAQATGCRLLRTAGRCGPAVARNLGARVARGEVLFFVDADVTVEPDAIALVAQAFAERPSLAALIGSYDDRPAEPNLLSQYKNLLHHYTHQSGCEDGHTFWGACGAIRRGVFLEVGGFDESYARPCVEDIELGYRLSAGGHAIWLCKRLQVKHLKRWTASNLFRTDFFDRALPWMDLILRDKRLDNDLNLNHSSRLCVAGAYLCVLSAMSAPLLPAYAPWLLVVAALSAVLVLALNRSLLCFLARKGGWKLAAGSAGWHGFYYLYCGAGFVCGLARHRLRGVRETLRGRRWPEAHADLSTSTQPLGKTI